MRWEFEPHKIKYHSTVTSGLCLACGKRGNTVVQQRTYLPDFYIGQGNFYVEVKGRLDSSSRRKMRDVKACNPTLDIRLLLLSDNKIDSRRPDRYSDWCKKNNYTYALKTIPLEWIK